MGIVAGEEMIIAPSWRGLSNEQPWMLEDKTPG